MKLISQNLTKHELWCVTVENKDDGRRDVVSYHKQKLVADHKAAKLGGAAVKKTAWLDEHGEWWIIEARNIGVDLPSKQEVLAKLSVNELRVLGV